MAFNIARYDIPNSLACTIPIHLHQYCKLTHFLKYQTSIRTQNC